MASPGFRPLLFSLSASSAAWRGALGLVSPTIQSAQQVLQAWLASGFELLRSPRRTWPGALADRRALWLVMVALVFCWNTALLWLSEQPENTQVLNLLLWLGLWIALEDQAKVLVPRPSRTSAFAGALVIALTLVRGGWISNDQDRFIYLVLPLLVLGLACLNRPLAQWRQFGVPILIALLLPLSRLITGLLPAFLNPLTAKLTWALLYSLGFQTVLVGDEVRLGSGGVSVLGPCSGVEQMIFTLSVVVIFLLVFPLLRRRHIVWVLLASIALAVGVNVARIALLAYCTSMPAKSGMPAFDFLHDSYGSLLFSLLAVSLEGWFYLKLLDRELSA